MRKYALIGEKLSHSISPFIHKQLFALYGEKADYFIIEIPKSDFDVKTEELSNLNGFNVTIPYKTNIISKLDFISDSARDMGAVNTVAVKDGKLYGYNTDIDGFLSALDGADIPLCGKVLILGSGGFSRMAVYSACRNGCEIFINSIEPESAEKIKEEMALIFPDIKVNLLNKLDESSSFDLIVNGTPVGMSGFDTESLPLPENIIKNSKAYFDAVYNPLETKAVRFARENNIPALSGLSMLVLQAAKAQEIWNGVSFNRNDIETIIGLSAEQI